jgi:hypothetical protein
VLELAEQRALRIERNDRIHSRDRVAMIRRREQRSFGERVARLGNVQDSLPAGAIDTRKAQLSAHDFVQAGRTVALEKQGFTGFERALDPNGTDRRGKPYPRNGFATHQDHLNSLR